MSAPQADPQAVDALIAQAGAQVREGRPEAALALLEGAEPGLRGTVGVRINRGTLLHALGRLPEALAAFDDVLSGQPGQPFALLGRGVVLADLGRDAEAAAALEAARPSLPGSVALAERLAVAYVRLARFAQALEASDAVLRLRAADAPTLALRADILKALRRPQEAAQCMELVLRMKPDHPQAAANLLRARALCADWRDRDVLVDHVRAQVRQGTAADQPFSFLAVSDDPAEQLACARAAVQGLVVAPAPVPSRLQAGRRVRVGYLSADYDNHPSMHLLAGVLERHDRGQFEIFGLSLGAPSAHPLRARCEAAVDTFVDLHGQDDDTVVRELRALQLDVLVDLNGFTNGGRVGVLARRVAPVQAGYLGYPGTMGGLLDYLIADAVVVPDAERAHYAEAVVRLPGCYQANDDRRVTAAMPSRADVGLSEQGFVYACFNHTYKIAPGFFAVWMRILRAVPRSLLWLLEDNAAATHNLRSQAGAHGVDPQRLVFAPRVPAPEHLARHAHADLVLDTLPYNAHTTASDALWTGVPLLTLPGRAFASRVAASLLHAAGLPELVCASIEHYEARAIELANDAAAHASLATRVAAARRRGGGPFDTPSTTSALEAAYLAMHERAQRGEPPADMAPR